MRPLSTLLALGLTLTGCGDDDRAVLPDASGPSTDGGGVDAFAPDASHPEDAGGDSNADVELTFTGTCAPDFGGDVVVVHNDSSVAVSSTSGGALTGSVQVALDGLDGPQALSSQHRVDTGAVINVVISTTWTNLAMDSGGVLGGTVPDPIGGTLRIDTYDRAAARLDLTFDEVTLQNPSDGSLCTVNGRLRTSGPSF